MPSPSCSPGIRRPRRSGRSCRNSTGCGPSPCRSEELTRAKRQFTRDFVLGRETVQQKASVLARAAVLHRGGVGSVDAEFDLFQGVSAADIQRVAQACFAPNTRMVITVTPRPAKEGAE